MNHNYFFISTTWSILGLSIAEYNSATSSYIKLKSNENVEKQKSDDKSEEIKVISVIEETLKKIEQVKNQISIYKSKLMALEDDVKKAVSKQSSTNDNRDKDFIKEELGFISIDNNIQTGIIINIAI